MRNCNVNVNVDDVNVLINLIPRHDDVLMLTMFMVNNKIQDYFTTNLTTA